MTQHFTRDNLPTDGWVQYRKTAITPMVRINGPFTVETREGPLDCEDGYLACPDDGWPYPVAADYHAANYEPVDDEAGEESGEAVGVVELPVYVSVGEHGEAQKVGTVTVEPEFVRGA